MLVRRRNLAERGDVGWFGSKLVKKIGKAAGSVVKVASKIPGVSYATAPYKLAGDVLKGKNVIKSARNRAGEVVSSYRAALPVAAGVVSFVPGVGTGVASGLSAAAALSQGKNLRQIAEEAAIGAVPGGQIARSALRAGVAVARGGNVLKTVAREGVSYARTQIPGGELAQRAFNVAENVARGGNVAKSVAREGVSYATKSIGNQIPIPSISKVAPMLLRRPSYGLVPSISPENIGRARSAVGLTRPNMRPNILAKARAAAFRPVSQNARAALLRAVPHMRGETAGLSASGAQWIIESGDTGSKIALKLTGNANRWIELRSLNPKVMSRPAADVKKYGFPVRINDVINLPASWIQVTAQTPAQSAPAQPAAAVPAPVSMPGGNLAAQSQARVVLAAWGRSDGASEAMVQDYGSASELGATSWTARDLLQANSFANWWRRNGGPPAVSDGGWSDELAQALNNWAEAKARQVANSALSAGGVVIPTLPTIVSTPAPATPSPMAQTPSAPSPSVLAPSGSTPTLTLPSVTIGGSLPSLPAPTSIVVSQGTPAPAQQSASTSGQPLSDNAKWGIWSAVGGAALSAAIRLL